MNKPETAKVRKSPQRRVLSHLPATCKEALEVLNDAAWDLIDRDGQEHLEAVGGAFDGTASIAAMRKARKILRDGLSVVDPKE